jgi:hypothetical protein
MLPTPKALQSGGEWGCAYPLDARASCGAPCQPRSPYCATHHRLCYLPHGSRAESRWLGQFEALADVVGGRRARDGAAPPRRFLDRLERIARGFGAH